MLKMNWTLSAVMLAAGFAGIAQQAVAQTPNYRGAFTLPFEARFGNVVLPAGNYAIATLDGAKGVRITGDTKSVAILSAGYDFKPVTENGKMTLVEVDGVYSLQSFESGSLGRTLHFIVGKSHRGNGERAGVAHTQTIEVGMQ